MKRRKAKSGKSGAAVRVQRLVRRLPTRKEWKAITDAAGSPLPGNVLWVINNWRWMCDALQACVQKYELGGAGYNVARVVIEEIEATHQPPNRGISTNPMNKDKLTGQ
jgi:hypothetical protein